MWCLWSKIWLLHLNNLKKLKLTWQKWNSSFKYEPNLTQREWGSIIVTRVLLWQSEVRTSLTRHKLLCQAAWREIWRGMKMAFLPFFSIKPASLPVRELARLGDYATAWKKTASQDNSFPLWEIYDCICVSISHRTASSAHHGDVSHSPLWQMSSAQSDSGLHCCTSSSARSMSALRPSTLRLNGVHGACRNGASLLWVKK